MKHTIFKYGRRYGIVDDQGRVAYEPGFTKKAAERIVQILTSPNPPKDWEATREILEREGFGEDDFEVRP